MTATRILACLWLLSSVRCLAAAEPFVQGRPLSYWLLLLNESEYRIPAPEMDSGPLRARMALRELDADSAPSAVPHLLAWFAERPYPDPEEAANRELLRHVLDRAGDAARLARPLLASFQPFDVQRPRRGDVPRLRRQVQEGDDQARYRAAELLLVADPSQAGLVVPFLAERLLDPDWATSTPEQLLARLGKDARAAVPHLAYRLQKEDRVSLATALAALDPDKAVDILKRKPMTLRQRVLRELTEKRSPGAATVAAALLGDTATLLDAAEALAVLEPQRAVAAVAALRAELRSLDPSLRLRSAVVLPLVDPTTTPEAVATLREIIRTEREADREAAVKVVRRLGKETVPVWLDLLDDPRWWYLALETLPRFGNAGQAAAPALKKLLRHEDTARATAAAWALAWIEPAALKEAIPALKKAATDRSVAVREVALLTLGHIGDGDAATLLVERLGQNTRPGELAAAAYALERLGKNAIPALSDALGAKDEQLQGNAARVLANLGPVARAALPALEQLQVKGSQLAQARAAFARARIGSPTEAATAVAALRRLVDKEDRASHEAALGLGRLARERDLARELVDLLKPSAPPVASLALCAAGPRPEIERLLLKRLRPSESVTLFDPYLLRALTAFGPSAWATVPSVVNTCRVEELRPLAEQTLAALGIPFSESLPRLLPMLQNVTLRPYVLALLRDMGKEAKDATTVLVEKKDVEALATFLSDRELVLARIKAQKWELLLDSRTGQADPEQVALVRGGGKELVSDLVALLRKQQGDKEYRLLLHTLSLAGEAAREGLPILRAALGGRQSPETEAILLPAAWRLRSLGIAAQELVPGLRVMVMDRLRKDARIWAAERLAELGKDALAAELELVKVVVRFEDNSAPWAALALIRMGKWDEALLKPLANLLNAKSTVDGQLVAAALAELGPQAGEVREQVFKHLQSVLRDKQTPDGDVVAFVRALVRIDPTKVDAVQKLLRLQARRGSFADTLGQLELGKAEVTILLDHLVAASGRHTQEEQRAVRRRLLALMGPPKQFRLRILEGHGVGTPEQWEMLALWGKREKDAIPTLIRILGEELDDLERGARRADLRRNCRSLADALGTIGFDAKEAVAVLKRMHHLREPELFLAAARALRRVDPKEARQLGIPE